LDQRQFGNAVLQQIEWACLYGSSDHRLVEPSFRQAARDTACEMMTRARLNLELILARLRARNYEFAAPPDAFVPPPSDVVALVDRLEADGIHLPVALEAWLIEVGTSVNLTGTDPRWPRSGYYGSGSDDVWFPDALFLHLDEDFIRYEFAEWQARVDLSGVDQAGPFCIPFAPDYLHKSNISGGGPYELPASTPSVDPLVLNERHRFSFVAYVRHAFEWGGFPGFEVTDSAPSEFLDEMRSGLLPI